MRQVLAIARRELIAVLASPIGALILGIWLFLQGLSFAGILGVLNQPGIRIEAIEPLRLVFGQTLFYWLFLFFVTAVISMRLIAEERRSGTLEILLASPLSSGRLVLGKLLGALAFYALLWLPMLVYVGLLASRGEVDLGAVAGMYLGVALLGFSQLGVGLLASALTRNQIVAAVLAFSASVLLFVVALFGELLGPQLTGLEQVNLLAHMDLLSRGLIDSRALVFHLSVGTVATFLAGCAVELGRDR